MSGRVCDFCFSKFVKTIELLDETALINMNNGEIAIIKNRIDKVELLKKIVNYPSVFKDFMVKEFIVETNVNENDSSVIKLYDKLYDQQLRLTILPTLQCNFRCEYCYETFKNEFISQDEIDLLCKAISIESKGKTGIFIDWFWWRTSSCNRSDK